MSALSLWSFFSVVLPLLPLPNLEVWTHRLQSANRMDPLEESGDVLQVGDTLEGLQGPRYGGVLVPLDIDPELAYVKVTLEGGSGDADLYIQFGVAPAMHEYERRPYLRGNEERLWIENPASGRWYLAVHGYEAFDGVRLKVEGAPWPDTDSELALLDSQDMELSLYYDLTDNLSFTPAESRILVYEQLRRRGREAFDAGLLEEAFRIWVEWAEKEGLYTKTRLLCRYYRIRLLPMIRSASERTLDLSEVVDRAVQDSVDGFTLVFPQMPSDEWFANAEELLLDTDLSLLAVCLDAKNRMVQMREIGPLTSLFAGPRVVRRLPMQMDQAETEMQAEGSEYVPPLPAIESLPAPDRVWTFGGTP